MVNKDKDEFVLNLVQLYFDFDSDEVEIIYYLDDDEYPHYKISFDEFKNILVQMVMYQS